MVWCLEKNGSSKRNGFYDLRIKSCEESCIKEIAPHLKGYSFLFWEGED